MTAVAFAVASVLIAGIASHVTHAYLRLRERERLSTTDRAVLEKRLDEFEKWKSTKVETFMANNRR